ncbi:MAG: HDIG domain-containing protein [Candidatus Bathyarchaeia archaeon]
MRKLPNCNEAIDFLKKVGCQPQVIKHSEKVKDVAVEIAKACIKNGINLNLDLIKAGALLHDIGRSLTHDVKHGFYGGVIAKAFNFPEELVRIIERHVGAGIPKSETHQLGLPRRDFVPSTIEEKIVSYADKLVIGTRKVDFKKASIEFRKSLSPRHPALYRFRKLHEEILNLMGMKNREVHNS